MLRFLTGPVGGKWAIVLPAEDSTLTADESREVKTAGTIYFLCQPSQRSKQTEKPLKQWRKWMWRKISIWELLLRCWHARPKRSSSQDLAQSSPASWDASEGRHMFWSGQIIKKEHSVCSQLHKQTKANTWVKLTLSCQQTYVNVKHTRSIW